MSTMKKRLRDLEAAIQERDDMPWVFVDVYGERAVNRATGEEWEIDMLFHLAEKNPDRIFIPFVHSTPEWHRPNRFHDEYLTPDDLRAENAGEVRRIEREDTRTPAEIEAEEASWTFWDEMARRSARRSGQEPCPFGRPWPPSTVERDKLAEGFEEDINDEMDDD